MGLQGCVPLEALERNLFPCYFQLLVTTYIPGLKVLFFYHQSYVASSLSTFIFTVSSVLQGH